MTDRLKVLIVEDEMMVALLAEDILTELGCEVIGPAMRLDEGLALAGGQAIDAAMLDVNLGAAKSFPIADVLRARGVPFFFATGYGIDGLTPAYRDELVVLKPYTEVDVGAALLRLELQGRRH